MIKRTLYFGNPAYLKTENEQLVVQLQNEVAQPKSIPIEDIGILILDHRQITITQSLLSKLLANNTAVITCDETHHPTGMLLTLDGNSLQSKMFQIQTEASLPLKSNYGNKPLLPKFKTRQACLAFKEQKRNYC